MKFKKLISTSTVNMNNKIRSRFTPLLMQSNSPELSTSSGEELQGLNPSQLAAVSAPITNNVRVIAGPGSGKYNVKSII